MFFIIIMTTCGVFFGENNNVELLFTLISFSFREHTSCTTSSRCSSSSIGSSVNSSSLYGFLDVFMLSFCT
jgi:hypothetical protein